MVPARNSTTVAALAAVKLGIPVAHLEAVLRSRDRSIPVDASTIGSRLLSLGFGDAHVRAKGFAWACHARKPV